MRQSTGQSSSPSQPTSISPLHTTSPTATTIITATSYFHHPPLRPTQPVKGKEKAEEVEGNFWRASCGWSQQSGAAWELMLCSLVGPGRAAMGIPSKGLRRAMAGSSPSSSRSRPPPSSMGPHLTYHCLPSPTTQPLTRLRTPPQSPDRFKSTFGPCPALPCLFKARSKLSFTAKTNSHAVQNRRNTANFDRSSQ